jgi:hypothetical protein
MLKKETIFIQIASYRDPQLVPTIKDCLEKAKHPENLTFCIAWQHSPDDIWDNLDEFRSDPRFKIIEIDYRVSEGACWARNKIQQCYDGETYTLQLDSHHRFIQNWDYELIKMYKNLQKKGHKKPLLTGYLPSFDPDNDPQARINIPWKMNFDRFAPEGVVHFLPASIDEFKELSSPIPARFYSGHFAFTTGKFAEEVQHDPDYYFHGEEISLAVRAFTHGYDLFHPHTVIGWHEYTRRGKIRHWDDSTAWVERNNKCYLRNRKLFGMDNEPQDIDFGKYGFGTERTLEDYERYAGISFKKRAVQKFTLENNVTPNPPLYGEEFEKSFLTVFKHCIDVSYNSVPENDYQFWVVACHAEDDTTLYRKDIQPDEINRLKNDPDGYCKIWVEFQTDTRPKYWVVWPYSKSKEWCDRLTGNIYN